MLNSIKTNKLISYLINRKIFPDDEQAYILAELSKILFSSRILIKKPRYSGIYIYGPPGRGKTMIMNTCMACFKGPKVWLHFHEFLRHINKKLFDMKAGANKLPEVLSEWLKPYSLVCFDEFHVHDIADSVLIGAFLNVVSSKRCAVILTSNYQPEGLFPDPVYHSTFLPVIELIKNRFKIMPLEKHDDYRAIKDVPENMCFFDCGMNASVISYLRQQDKLLEEKEDIVKLSGRSFNIFIKGGNTIGFRFDELCGADSSYLDYLELSENYSHVFLKNIKDEHFQNRNVMLRFVWLLDVLYDKRIRLYATSDRPLIDMVSEYFTVNDAFRCISRLNEMQYGLHIKSGGW